MLSITEVTLSIKTINFLVILLTEQLKHGELNDLQFGEIADIIYGLEEFDEIRINLCGA